MKLKVFLLVIVACFYMKTDAQELTQVVKGRVLDIQTTYPVAGANVIIEGSNPLIGTSADSDGYFRLEGVPVGRQNLIVNIIGYNSSYVSNIQVNSAKEVYLEIKLEEQVHQLDEAVVVAYKKSEVLDEMALISSRTFTVDEAARYAGSLNDPARMAANFAGANSTGDMRNDIVVRGNSPNGIIYRLEGLNIPNPNHLGTTGASGGYYSMLSQNTLSNSDFLTGAFPAKYGNALGGVFDLNFRKGNSEKREYAFTFGLNGMEATAEGPFSKNSRASYLINYRYSTLGAFDAIGVDLGAPAVPKFQDVSFKVHFPLNNGYIKLFGLGGVASIDLKDSDVEDPKDFFTLDKPSDLATSSGMGVIGISNKYFFNQNTFGEAIISAHGTFEDYHVDTLVAPDFKTAIRQRQGVLKESTYSAQYNFTTRLNSKHKFVAGVQGDFIKLDYDQTKNFNNENETKFKGDTKQFSGYMQWLFRTSDFLSFTVGSHARYYDLSDNISIEPRASMKWKISDQQSLNLGYGLHSQGLPYYTAFIKGDRPDGTAYNKYGNIAPSKSHHFIAGYNYQLSKNIRLKVDGYYQSLFDIPVEKEITHWSAVNVGGDFFGFPEDLSELENSGTGTNMGVEFTLERFLSEGYYYLLTTSIFDSKYKGSDGVERNTAFNGNYVFNFLAGKEFKVGRNKQNTFGIDLKTTYMGGRRYIPINYQESQLQKEVIYNNADAYESKQDDYFRMDLKFTYTLNKPRFTHQFVLDIQNITGQENIFKENYNISTGNFSYEYQQGFMPNIQYRLIF